MDTQNTPNELDINYSLGSGSDRPTGFSCVKCSFTIDRWVSVVIAVTLALFTETRVFRSRHLARRVSLSPDSRRDREP